MSETAAAPVSLIASTLATAAAAVPIVGGVASVIGVVFEIVHTLQGDDNKTRETFTRNLVDNHSAQHPGFNVVVVHTSHSIARGSKYVHMHQEVGMKVGTCGYEIYVSPKGSPFVFTLNGDGGYINWAYEGEFSRNDKTITAAVH